MKNHSSYMAQALRLALNGEGRVSPNPLVGCVIVNNGKIVGQGHHAVYGGPHAEINALAKAGEKAKGATAYITLEPCSHWGKTPPCAPHLIQAGIKSVFIAMKDPNPKVSGRGIALLKKAGIKVNVGLKEQEAKELNTSFITWMTKKRPYTILKMAMTLDGKIASVAGHSRWITSPMSRKFVHALRKESDAVLIGAGTAVNDNPQLTSHGSGRNPIRVLVDPHLRVPLSAQIYNVKHAATIVVSSTGASKQKRAKLKKKNITVIQMVPQKKMLNPKLISTQLGKSNISRLLIEGGGETAWPFIKENLVDEFFIFVAPQIIGGRTAPTPVGGEGIANMMKAIKLNFNSVTQMGSDILIRAKRI